MKHEQPPAFCAACIETCQALAEKAVDHHVLKRCTHRRDGLSVLAVALVGRGEILSWTIYGPLTEAEGDTLGVQLALMLEAGTRHPRPTVQ